MEKNCFLRNLLALVAAATLSAGITSCKEDKNPTLELDRTNVEFDAKGNGDGVVNITVEDTGWDASFIDGADHFSLDKMNSEKSERVTIKAKSENLSEQDYKATIRIKANKDSNLARLIYVTQKKPDTLPLAVSPKEVSLLGEKGSTNTIEIKTSGDWTLQGCPEWLHLSATSGSSDMKLTLTTLSENWSDTERSATLTVKTKTSSATVEVSQRGTLPIGLRVETSNMTIMRDGFACDLIFGPNAKGHREAFFTEQDIRTKTDRDIYDELMKKQEWNTLEDYTFLPDKVEPNTTIIYCVAAYGNETNEDGTHKYGPMTIQRIKTRSSTIYDDMYLTKSYNSIRWTVSASRQGSYGQRCDEFYYIAAEGDMADEFYLYNQIWTDALLAHLYFKPEIAKNRNWHYCNGPQTMNWTRDSDIFYCTTWGIDRDTREFSAELSTPVYYDLSSSSVKEFSRPKSNPSEWNKRHLRPTREEIQKMRNALQIYRISK